MSLGAAEFAPIRYSTSTLPVGERLPFWREVFGRQFCHLDIEPLSDVPFEAEVSLRALPGLSTMSCSCVPTRQRRTIALMAHGDDSIALPMTFSGTAVFSQRGREVSVTSGDAVLMLNAEPAVMVNSHFNSSGLLVPRAALMPLVADVEDKTMRLIPHRNEALRLLVSYVQAMQGDLALASPALCHTAVTHIYDLVALTIGATRDGAAIARERGARAARLAAIKADINVHIGGRGLSLSALAARHDISPRSVQLLFEAEGVTFSQFVTEQRLARAHRMLTDLRYAESTISAIALASGFGDLSHFNRSFRRRYGATPSDVRAHKLR